MGVDTSLSPTSKCAEWTLNHFRIPSSARALEILPSGRFGNNFYQLCWALIACRYIGYRQIFIEPLYMFLNRTFTTTEGIQIIPGTAPKGIHAYKTHMLEQVSFQDPCHGLSHQEIADTFRHEFTNYVFPTDVSNASVLYLYIRSGDNWIRGRKNIGYYPPPCSYYFDGPRFNVSFADTEIISEDEGNPCVRLLRAEGIKHVIRPLEQDFAILLWSHRVMDGVSSFIRAILMICAERKQLFTFNNNYERHFPHIKCQETREYRDAMTPWKKSDEQIRVIKTMRGCVWEYVSSKGGKKISFEKWSLSQMDLEAQQSMSKT